MVFNYSNLSDKDFEVLSCDIVSRIVGDKVRTFAAGRDGGIDGQGLHDNGVIVQSKFYMKSSLSNLMSTLRKEVSKVKSLDPNRYFITVSKELTKNNIEDIYDLFVNYMEDDSQVLDLCYIDDFLSSESNKDILLKHPKLYFTSHAILLDVMSKHDSISSMIYQSEIFDKSKLFIRTKCFFSTLSLLRKSNVVLLTGNAGVGKTTTSELLVMLYNLSGYELVSNVSSNYSDVFSQLNSDESKKEIILLDDFLGQSYLQLQESSVSPIRRLINYVKNSKNKKLIMNSRITVLTEARNVFDNLGSVLDSDIAELEINMNQVSDIEKASILRSMFIRHNVPRSKYDLLIQQRNYLKIINHSNFTPRSVEYFCKNHTKYSDSEFFRFMIDTLDDGYQVWNNEFTHKLGEEDKIYLVVLYSLGHIVVSESILKESLEHYILENDIMSFDYESITSRLNDSFINTLIKNGKRYIQFKNPSITEYIKKKLNDFTTIRNRILLNPINLDQVEVLMDIVGQNQLIIDRLPDLFLLKNYDYPKGFFYIKLRKSQYQLIKRFKIKKLMYKNYLQPRNMLKMGRIPTDYLDLICDKDLVDYYSIGVYDDSKVFEQVYRYSDIQTMVEGLVFFDNYFREYMDHDILGKMLETKLIEYLDQQIKELIKDAFSYEDIFNEISRSEISIDANGDIDISEVGLEEAIAAVAEFVYQDVIHLTSLDKLKSNKKFYNSILYRYNYNDYLKDYEEIIFNEISKEFYYYMEPEPDYDRFENFESEPNETDNGLTAIDILSEDYPID